MGVKTTLIADVNGEQINDFEGMAESDRVDIIAKQQKLRREQETKIRASILQSLQRTFTEDRCRDMNVAVEMDMSEKKKAEKMVSLPMKRILLFHI